MKRETLPMPTLLDYLADGSGSQYLSDLHFIEGFKKVRLIQKIEQISSRESSLKEWNDALNYLTGLPGETSSEKARMKLLSCLKDSL